MSSHAWVLLWTAALLVVSCGWQLASADEPALSADWQPLFNGKDLDGWEGVGSSLVDDWKIVDGVLQGHGTGGGWIAAPKEFEFRISPGGNSGVFLRAPANAQLPHIEGLEVQLLDDTAKQYAQLSNAQRCGSLLLEAGRAKRVSTKPDEWQTMAIECQGTRVRVALNGQIIVDQDFAKSEPLDDHPGRKRTTGRIGFQDHGERVDFRHVMIRELK